MAFNGTTNPVKARCKRGCVHPPSLTGTNTMMRRSSRTTPWNVTMLTAVSSVRGLRWTPRLEIQLGGFDQDPPCAPTQGLFGNGFRRAGDPGCSGSPRVGRSLGRQDSNRILIVPLSRHVFRSSKVQLLTGRSNPLLHSFTKVVQQTAPSLTDFW